MQIVQKWLAGLIGIGALVVVATNPTGVATGLKSAEQFVSGTEKTAMGR